MKKIMAICTLSLVGVLVCGTVLAQSTGTQLKKAKSIAYCNDISKNVDKRITNFENNKAKHVAQYEKTQKKMVALVDKLEAEGKDVTILRADLVTFEQKIADFKADYSTYVINLGETKDFTCGKSEGEFKSKLAISRGQLKVVHDDSVSIRTYWAQTIKPQIEALKTTPVVTPTVEEGTI